jgi:hypothetical protein
MKLVGEVRNTRNYDDMSQAIMGMIHAAEAVGGVEAVPQMARPSHR